MPERSGAGGQRKCSLGLEPGKGIFKAASWLMGPWACVYGKAGRFPFNSFFSQLYFKVVHFTLIFSQGTRGPVEGSVYLFIQHMQMELQGVIIMKSLIILIYYQ